jgi:hypothetical protein
MTAPDPKKADDLTTAEAIKMFADAIAASQPRSAEESVGLSKERMRELTSPLPASKFRLVPGKNHDTGCTFDLVVVESKEFPSGRVTAISNYRHPPTIYQYQSNGGLVPDGYPMFNVANGEPPRDGGEVPRHFLTPQYLQWRWETFWKEDLRTIVGKRLSESMCATPEGMKTPWKTTSQAA